MTYESALTSELAEQQASQFKLLACPTRLRILNLLVQYGGQIHVEQIALTLGLVQPTISHHLRILRKAGLIDDGVAHGLYTYYGVRREALAQLQGRLTLMLQFDQEKG